MELRQAVVCVGLLALAACSAEASAPAPKELLPDLDQAPPAAISVVQQNGQERLVFLSAVENGGTGPLLVSEIGRAHV